MDDSPTLDALLLRLLLKAIEHSANKNAHEFEVFQHRDGTWIARGRCIGSGPTLRDALNSFVSDYQNEVMK